MKTPMKTEMSSTFVSSGGSASDDNVLIQDGKTLEDRVSILEARPTMPAKGSLASEGDVLGLDVDLRPRWDAGSSLTNGNNDDDILVWNDTTEKWVVFDSSTSALLFWNKDVANGSWQLIDIPADDSKVLQTYTPESGEPPIKFDFLVWR